MTKCRHAELSKITSGNAVGKATEVSRRMHLSPSVVEHMQALGAAPKTRLDALVALGLTGEEIAAQFNIPVQSVHKLCDVWSIQVKTQDLDREDDIGAEGHATGWTDLSPATDWRKYG